MPLWRFLPVLAWVVGCGPRLDEDEVDGLRRLSGTVSVGGLRTLRLEPEPGETAALLTVVPAFGWTAHVSTVEVDGEVVFDAVDEAKGDLNTTNAGYLSLAATLNWPRSAAEALTELRVELGNVDEQGNYSDGEVAVDVRFKRDADLDAGSLAVALVWTGETVGDAALQAAVAEAIDVWRDLYAGAGIALDPAAELDWPVPAIDAPVYGTDGAWTEIASRVGPHVVPVVFTDGIHDVDDVLGVAGDIPGPLVATTRSGVLVDALSSAGPDGVFDALEIRLLGETMAHEVGHYLGLYHPVETTWDRWDALDDTEACGGEARCVDQLGDALMFPFPVCGLATCRPQDRITPDQAGVAHRWTGVR